MGSPFLQKYVETNYLQTAFKAYNSIDFGEAVEYLVVVCDFSEEHIFGTHPVVAIPV